MDLRQLAALTAVADHQSFSAAARALHTVQSNVSTHVARLERELGTPLVDRASGSLTDAGELVVARARRVQAELEALASDVASSLGEISGQLRLGVIGTTGRWLTPILLRALTEAHPKVRIVLVDATTTSLLPQLASGQLDLAVVNLPVNHPDIEAEPLFEEDHVVVAPLGHLLARRTRVRLDELAGVPMLLEPHGTGFRDDLEADAARAGVALVAQAEIDGMRLLASLAFQGFGAAILPASAVQRGSDDTWRAIPLDGCTPRAVGLAVHRRSRLSAAARATRDVLCEVILAEAPRRPGFRLVPASS
ncbi:MAG: putative LysR family transcriptional regulator [Acidimicrobiales bacterium]|nr:putative LysR family transcriptional regulator [Acidimicrobiales bacterium]